MMIDVLSVSLSPVERENLLRYPVRKNVNGILRSPVQAEKEGSEAMKPTSPTSTLVLELQDKRQAVVKKSSSGVVSTGPVPGTYATRQREVIDTLSFSFDDDTSTEGGELLGLRCLDEIDYSEGSAHEGYAADATMIFAPEETSTFMDSNYCTVDMEGKKRIHP
jgi:hypothetical protein